mgnify:FL=1
MTDIHTHTLYGLDDGSEGFEMSLKMLSMASKGGTKNIILTPHCNIPGGYLNYMNSTIADRFERLKAAAKEFVPDINLYLGMEVYASNDIPELLRRGMAITLNRSRYLLVEFNFGESPMYVFKVLQNIQRAGIVPVLAHPERYVFVQQEPYIVFDLVRAGIIIQINRGSILGKFGLRPKAAADYLLKSGMVHIVASDGHKSYSRIPILYDAYAEVKRNYGKEYADMLFKKNPQNILLDKSPAFLKAKLRYGKEF